jgi:hypothetical protein
MTKLQPSLLEVTRALTNRARAAHFEFGEDTALVAAQHMLWQTVDLFEAIVALGVKHENIFALGKIYSNSPAVIGALRDRGVTVVESTFPQPGEFDRYFQHDVRRLWEVVKENLPNRHIKRILVLDDGGRCITNMPNELLQQYAACGVEQTSHGMFVFEEKTPPLAVIPWARSAVKLLIGGPIFSHCLLIKLQTLFLDGNPLVGQNVGVIGLGSIGSAMANLTARQNNNVIFYDSNPELQVPPYLQGRIARVNSLEELLLACDYVFGCSGRNPFRDRWPLKYRPGIKLFSGSGGDHEFGPIINDLKFKPGFRVTERSWDIACENGPCGPLFIAYLGYPYNFVSRDIEAVPVEIVQIETGGLLAALIQARFHLALSEKGLALNTGIHRISPEAQRFVYETWLTAMKGRGIDLHQVYGCDPAMLQAARGQWWFIENSEPPPSATYQPNEVVEDAMARMIEENTASQLGNKRNVEPDLCSF